MNEPTLHECKLLLCSLCLDGAGGECHTPGCILWINRAPDLSLREHPCLLEIDGQPGSAYRAESLAATPPEQPRSAAPAIDPEHDALVDRLVDERIAGTAQKQPLAAPPLTYAEGKRDAARIINTEIATIGNVDSAWAGIAAVRLGPLLSELASLDEGAAPPGDARRLLANVLAKRRTLENATSHEIGNAVEDLGEAEAEAYAFLASTPEAPRTAADGYAECERDVMAMLDAIVARNTKWGDKADSILEARVCLSKDNHVGAFERARAAARAKGGG